MKTYKYGMKFRPFSIGCQPKNGLVDVLESSEYYDVVIYDRELTLEEIARFELIEIVENN